MYTQYVHTRLYCAHLFFQCCTHPFTAAARSQTTCTLFHDSTHCVAAWPLPLLLIMCRWFIELKHLVNVSGCKIQLSFPRERSSGSRSRIWIQLFLFFCAFWFHGLSTLRWSWPTEAGCSHLFEGIKRHVEDVLVYLMMEGCS